MWNIAMRRSVSLEEVLGFVRANRRAILATTRRDGEAQMSPTLIDVDDASRILLAARTDRVETDNVRRHPRVSLCVLSDGPEREWVEIDGHGEVVERPTANRALDSLHRSLEVAGLVAGCEVAGDEVLIRITVDRWGPISGTDTNLEEEPVERATSGTAPQGAFRSRNS